MTLLTLSPLDPELRLALAYVPHARRGAVEALWMLDEQLGRVVRTTREPMVGRIRLAWWRDALSALERGEAAPGEPLLRRLDETVFAPGHAIAGLSGIAEGWSLLLDPLPLDAAALKDFAVGRGAVLFGQAATILGGGAPRYASSAGRGWALVDLAAHCSDPQTATRAIDLARAPLAEAIAGRWPVPLRPLGMLAQLAWRDLEGVASRRQGSPARLLRMMRHRITGR